MQDLSRLSLRFSLGIVTAAFVVVSATAAWSQTGTQPPKFEDTKRWIYDAKGGREVTVTAEQQRKQWEKRQARKAKRKAAKAAEQKDAASQAADAADKAVAAAKEANKAAEASKDAAKAAENSAKEAGKAAAK